MVSEMHQSGLASRAKAAQALGQIRSDVLQVRSSDKVPEDLLHSTLIAIDEAQTALTTDSAQTIAWSLQTVGQEVQAVQAKLTGQNPPQTASAERPINHGGGTQAPDQTSTAKAPEQQGARVAEAERKTGVVPQPEQGPNANLEKRVRDERGQETDRPSRLRRNSRPSKWHKLSNRANHSLASPISLPRSLPRSRMPSRR